MRWIVALVLLFVVSVSNSSWVSAQSSAPGDASDSDDRPAIRAWLAKGLAEIDSMDDGYQAEIYTTASVIQSQLGDKVAAKASLQKALGLLGKVSVEERMFVRSEIARAWAWIGEDERAKGYALLGEDEFDRASTLIRIASVQRDRGEIEEATETLKLVNEKINAMKGDRWEQDTLRSDLVNAYGWMGSFNEGKKTLELIRSPELRIDAQCWLALAETKLNKMTVKRKTELKTLVASLEQQLGQVDPEEIPFSASNVADLYARLGDTASAERLLELVTEPSSRSYTLAAVAAAYARAGEQDKFKSTLKRSIDSMEAIRFDPDIENDVAYDKAWALASIASTMVYEGNMKGAKPLFNRAKPGLQKAVTALLVAETLLDELTLKNRKP